MSDTVIRLTEAVVSLGGLGVTAWLFRLPQFPNLGRLRVPKTLDFPITITSDYRGLV